MASDYENDELAQEQQANEDVAQDAKSPEEKHDFQWYILKVQVNRETRVLKELERRVRASAVVSPCVGEMRVPVTKVEEYRAKDGQNKKYTRTVKKFPGYIMVYMDLTEDTWFLLRGTPGVGDFTGSFGRKAADGSYVKPLPMTPEDVELMLGNGEEEKESAPKVEYVVGDLVRVVGENMKDSEGRVVDIDEANEKVTVEINLFNKPTPVQFNTFDVEKCVK